MPIADMAAMLTSTSEKIRLALLPPSSSDTRLMPSADAARIRCPTARLPVNVTLSTSG